MNSIWEQIKQEEIMGVDINQVILTGRLTRDAEIKQVGEHTIAEFSLAIGHVKDAVSFIDCKAWNRTAEIVQQFTSKGKEVAVVGEFRQERWEKDGQKRSKVVVSVNKLKLLGSKTDAVEGGATTATRPVDTEDIPF